MLLIACINELTITDITMIVILYHDGIVIILDVFNYHTICLLQLHEIINY